MILRIFNIPKILENEGKKNKTILFQDFRVLEQALLLL